MIPETVRKIPPENTTESPIFFEDVIRALHNIGTGMATR
jgi:hypothetical protein